MKTALIISDKAEFFELMNEWYAAKPITEKQNVVATQDDYLTQREAARFLKITLPTIIAWKKEKKIPYYQEGRKVLFRKSELLEAIQKVSTSQIRH